MIGAVIHNIGPLDGGTEQPMLMKHYDRGGIIALCGALSTVNWCGNAGEGVNIFSFRSCTSIVSDFSADVCFHCRILRSHSASALVSEYFFKALGR